MMEITGKITRVFEVVTGNGKKGMWSKQEFILEQPGQYPKNVCLQLWGKDLIDKYDLDSALGITVTAHINIESREWQGKYFTDVRCWKLEWDANQKRSWQPGGAAGKAGGPASDDRPQEEYKQPDLGSGPQTDDLPF